jgi:hypothetical protein
MAAEDVGRGELGGDALLPGIDDVGSGGRRRDLAEVPWFHRITKHDAHHGPRFVNHCGGGCRGRRRFSHTPPRPPTALAAAPGPLPGGSAILPSRRMMVQL